MKRIINIISVILIVIIFVTCEQPTKPKVKPPKVLSTIPKDKTKNVPIETKIAVYFSKQIDTATIKRGFSLVSKGINPSLHKTSDNEKVFMNNEKLQYEMTYTAEVNTNIKDLDGNSLNEPYSWTFTTVEVPDTLIAPRIISVSPENDAQDIAVDTIIVLEFSKQIDTATVRSGFSLTSNGTQASIEKISMEDNKVSLTPEKLQYEVTYTAEINDNIKDLDGNSLNEGYSWIFTTIEAPDTTSPKIIYTNPIDHSHGIPVDIKQLTIQFDEPIKITSPPIFKVVTDSTTYGLNIGYFYYYDTLEINFSVSNNELIINILDSLEYITKYEVDLDSNVTDLAGNYLKNRSHEEIMHYWYRNSHLNFYTMKDPNLWRLPEKYVISQINTTTRYFTTLIHVGAWYPPRPFDYYQMLKNHYLIYNANGKLITKKDRAYLGVINNKVSDDMVEKGDNIFVTNNHSTYCQNSVTGQVKWKSIYEGDKIEVNNEGIFLLDKVILKLDIQTGSLVAQEGKYGYKISDFFFFGDYVITFGRHNDKATLGKIRMNLSWFVGMIHFPKPYTRIESIENGEFLYLLNEETDSIELWKQYTDSLVTEWEVQCPLDSVITTSKDTDGNLYLIDRNTLMKISRNDGHTIFQTTIPSHPMYKYVKRRLPHLIKGDIIYVPSGRYILRYDTYTGQKITD